MGYGGAGTPPHRRVKEEGWQAGTEAAAKSSTSPLYENHSSSTAGCLRAAPSAPLTEGLRAGKHEQNVAP